MYSVAATEYMGQKKKVHSSAFAIQKSEIEIYYKLNNKIQKSLNIQTNFKEKLPNKYQLKIKTTRAYTNKVLNGKRRQEI